MKLEFKMMLIRCFSGMQNQRERTLYVDTHSFFIRNQNAHNIKAAWISGFGGKCETSNFSRLRRRESTFPAPHEKLSHCGSAIAA